MVATHTRAMRVSCGDRSPAGPLSLSNPAPAVKFRNKVRSVLPAVVLFCFCGTAARADFATYRVRRTDTPPVIDGSLSDACWADACRVTSFHLLGTPVRAGDDLPPTEALLTYGSRALYIAFRCREPLAAGLEAPERPHDGPTWRDNGVEIFLDPSGDRVGYVQIAVNLAGAIMDGFISSPGGSLDLSWETGASAAVRIGDREWTLELRVPFSGLPLTRPRGAWTFHLARNRAAAGQHLTSLRTPVSGYHEIANFARLEGIDLPDMPVCVTRVDVGECLIGENRCRVQLHNWSRDPATVDLSVGIQTKSSPRVRKPVQMAVPGGRTVTATLPWTLEAGDGGGTFTFEVRLAKTGRLLHKRVRTLPEPPPMLGEIERPVFYYRQGRCVPLALPVNLAEGSRGRARLTWQARDARGAVVGHGFTSVPGRNALLRLYWPHWFPGRYSLHMTLTRSGRVLAESEQPLRLVENPWNEQR